MVTADSNLLQWPGRREVSVDRLPVERRRRLLQWLAETVLENREHFPAEAEDALVSAWCRHSPDLEDRWLDYRERFRILTEAKRGVLDWRVVNDRLTCAERTEAAREIAHQDADDALAALIGSSR
jgi:hypothetical protein